MKTKHTYSPQTVLHPGIDLTEKLEEIEMGTKEFAVRTNKPEKTINAVLKGESSITPEMAVLFENVLHIPANYWLNRQRNYDEYLARLSAQQTLKKASDWARSFPLNELIKCGWIEDLKPIEERANALLSFFGFSNIEAWGAYYYERQLKVAFRISLHGTKNPYALSAWLRQGELEAKKLQVPVYNEKLLKSNLTRFKEIMVKQSASFFEELQQLCGECGVALVLIPCIKGTQISGASRWVNDTPVVQMSGRHNRYDIFWFTFFHELGHILLHGKKDIFLEEITYSDADMIKEAEADSFAVKHLLTDIQVEKVVKDKPYTKDKFVKYANEFQTHSSIIVGRLKKLKAIEQFEFSELIIPFSNKNEE